MRQLIAFAIVANLALAPALSAQSVGETIFSAAEKSIIEDYYGRSEEARRRLDTDDDDDGIKTRASQGKNKGKAQGKGQGKDKGKSGDMPPGLAAKDELPPHSPSGSAFLLDPSAVRSDTVCCPALGVHMGQHVWRSRFR